MRVSRTCTEIQEENSEQRTEANPRPLEDFRSVPAYVLLGDPGAGKTTAFEMEYEVLGQGACLVPARDFLTFDPQNRPEWRGKTLFIDGLDEVRAGSSDANTPFDEIRNRLDALGKPRFRLSCREADWLGANDRKRLKTVSPDSAVKVLRLDPLTYENITSILNARPDIADARDFIFEARERDVAGFSENPQTLKLLAEVVGAGGEWPASRKELFEEACARMVREQNEEHRAAKALNNLPDPADLLDAAGRLCAVQLISGAAGWTLHGEGNEAYPAPDRCDYDRREMLWPALATKLFKGVSNTRLAPVHRHIAEFLAARHLAGVIEAGVPARRIIALITGKDGMVVTEMRGLSAWLAAYSKDARAYLIEQDPVGVGLYGDIGGFFTDEKRALLYSLKGEKHRLDYPGWKRAEAFRALVTPDMESVIRDILTDSNRAREHQRVIGFVLSVLRENDSLPDISGILLEMVRDDTWWSDVNLFALDAFIRNCPDDDNKTRQLKALLADIQSGSVSDPDHELLGTLLTHLYPRDLSPSEVWDYFFEIVNPLFFGRYDCFWQVHLIDRDISSDEQVAELLDNLHKWILNWPDTPKRIRLEDSADPISYEDFLSEYSLHPLQRLPVILLARGLKAHGDRIDTKRLYDWLGAGLAGSGGSGSNGQKALSEIRLWMEHHSEVQKEVISEGLERCSASDSDKDFDICTLRIWKRLYGASRPPDYGLWCLEQAVALADSNSKPRIAKYLLGEAALTLEGQNGNEGLSLDLLIERAGTNAVLQDSLSRLLAPRPISPWKQERREQEKKYAEEARQEKEKLLAYVRSNESALRENRAVPYLLYQIAQAYFGAFAKSSGCNGPQAVSEWLHGDRNLTDAALQGLRGVIDRGDVPEIEEVLDLYEQNRLHYLVWPFLTALVEVERTAPEDDASQWDEDRIRKAVTFWHCNSYSNDLPQWYERLLLARPEIVAEVQVHCIASAFRSGYEHVAPDLFKLARDLNHAQVAKHASLPLLRVFPVRCTLKQVKSLDYLLWAATRHADRTSLTKLIERKRSLTSMNVAQRIRWLAAGTIIAPEAFGGALEDFVQAQKRRIRSLWEFIDSGVKIGFAFRDLDISVMEFLIRLVGGHFGPKSWGNPDAPLGEMTLVTPEMKASDFVSKQIPWLAKFPEEEASKALARLVANPALERWRDVLKQAQDNQRTIRRDAGYHHPNIEQTCKTLDGGTPANPADLAALLVDRLDDIGSKIRSGPTSDWRQYWNVDPYNRPQDPKPENACRDNLLSDLQEKFRPLGIDAQPEGQYANDTEADIRISYTHASAEYFQVPVEIKKNSHPKLWSAIRNQLIAKYTIDPDTDGYGIYLVFWFGEKYTRTPSSSDGYPANAEEMKKWLEDSLSPDEARKISVCVIDVSIPEGKSAGK